MTAHQTNPPVTLTATRISAIGVPATRTEIRDAQQPGLRLRISEQGTRSWVWLKKVNGRTRRITLGRYPEIDIADARKAAAKLSGEAAMGTDPAQARKEARVTSMTYADAYADYMQAKTLRPSTQVDYDQLFRRVATLHHKPVSEITRDDIERLHRSLSKESPSRANGAMRVVRAVLNRAIDRIEDAGGAGFTNPVRRLSSQGLWNKTERKTNRIATQKLPEFVHAVRSDPSPVAGDLVLMLLGTGWRLGETRRLLWSDVDLTEGTVTLRAEETKAGRRVTLPIPEQVRAMLTIRRAKKRPSSKHVFEERTGKPIASGKALLARVATATGISAGHHDLRRTFASIADREGVGSYTIKKLLNHATDSRDVTAGYIAADMADLRRAQQTVADITLGVMP